MNKEISITSANTSINENNSSLVTSSQSIDTSKIIMTMLEKGVDASLIEKAMDLQDRQDQKLQKQKFYAAKSAFKSEMPVVPKTGKVDFKNKAGIRTNYDFGTLGDLARICDPILSKNGLSYSFRQTQNGNMITVYCVLHHKDGYSEESSITAPIDTSSNKDALKGTASTISYLSRYTLKGLLGAVFDGEDDENLLAPKFDYISSDQVDELRALIKEKGRDEQRLLDYISKNRKEKVTSLNELKEMEYKKVKSTLVSFKSIEGAKS